MISRYINSSLIVLLLTGSLRTGIAGTEAANEHDVEFARAQAKLGVFYQDLGKFSQAEASFINCLKVLKELGSEDLALVPVIVHLGWLYVETGQTTKASRLHPEAWVALIRRDDPESKYLPSLLEIVGGFYALKGKTHEAEEMYRQDFNLLDRRGVAASIDMASALNNFGFLNLHTGRYDNASKAFSTAVELWSKLSGPDDLRVATSRVGLAEAYLFQGRSGDSATLLEQALPIFEHKSGANSVRTADVLTRYARVLRLLKRISKAKEYETRAAMIRNQVDILELAKQEPPNFFPRLDDVHNPKKASKP
jgi:tetratricopeptide (TPR) repeat protein